MALGFPRCLGVGYDTIEALLALRGPCLSMLAGLLGRRSCWPPAQQCTGFVGGGLLLPSLFHWGRAGNCLCQWLGESGLHWRCRPPAYRWWGMAAVLARQCQAAPLTALLLLV